MEEFHKDIVAAYLYVITKYGYPPEAGQTPFHMEELRKLGFQSVELEGIRKDHLEKMHSLNGEIRKQKDALQMHIPVFCAVLPGLSSADQSEREENLELFTKGCETATTLGATIILDNAPIPPWKFPEGIPVTRHYDVEVIRGVSLPEELNWDLYWQALVETYREACRIAGSNGLTFHLHPCSGSLVNSTDAFLLFAEAVKSDHLRFNLDTANQFFMRENLYLALIRMKGHIGYIHLSDNRGNRVEHLAAGKGTIQWDGFFEGLDRIGYRGLFGIDVGGAESDIPDLDEAYVTTAVWLMEKWFRFKP